MSCSNLASLLSVTSGLHLFVNPLQFAFMKALTMIHLPECVLDLIRFCEGVFLASAFLYVERLICNEITREQVVPG